MWDKIYGAGQTLFYHMCEVLEENVQFYSTNSPLFLYHVEDPGEVWGVRPHELTWGEMREGEHRQAVDWVSEVPATSEVGTVAVVPWTCSHLQVAVIVNTLMGNVNTVGCCCFINQWDYKWFVRLLTSKWKDLIDWSENYQQDWEKKAR